jgi:site-specific DNA-methyltransferase (adenine-specific)
MSLLTRLPEILEKAREEYETADRGRYDIMEIVDHDAGNLLAFGENLQFMKYLAGEKNLAEGIKLIYVDPPFYSGSNYQASIKIESPLLKDIPAIKPLVYDDRWEHGIEDYLTMLCARLFMMRDLLSEDGSIWVHLDWHVVHYVKILMDAIFGEKNFINEIIWLYKSGGTSKNHFSRKHDTLLFYGKNTKPALSIPLEKSYNRGYKPYRFKGVNEYKDDLGWYTMVNMKDVWQIDMVGRTSGERTGYATQKPEALIRRILESCTAEEDLCADFFCGAGTLAATAHKMNRRWIACDMGPLAVTATEKRLAKEQGAFALLVEKGLNIKGAGLLTLRGEFPETPFTDKILLRLTLEDYRLRVEDLLLEDESKSVVDSILEADPLQLIDFWSVDFDYDGKNHRPTMCFVKGKDCIETVCEKMHDRFARVSLRICDVFGNSYFHVLDMTEHHHE